MKCPKSNRCPARLARVKRTLLAVSLVMPLAPVFGGDWPAFRHDIARSAVTDEKLSFPLQLAWRYTCPQPPAPAWRPATKTLNRLEFDYASHPVAADGIVCLGSSSDDTIRALDAGTGQEKWRFITGGPVRFAPQIVGGRVYAASDDGFVYCLDAGTGKPAWMFRVAPDDDRLPGDTRMISRWPLRCGVLVDGGVVYTVAGMWPSEGVFVYAIDAATGRVIWCNDTGGRPAPWEVAKDKNALFQYSGLTPQGPLLAGKDTLIVPMGRATPAGFDRKTGEMLYFNPGKKGALGGGIPFAVVDEKYVLYNSPPGGRGKPQVVHLVGVKRGGAGSSSEFGNVPQPHVSDGLDVNLIVTQDRFYARNGYGMALAGETLVVGEKGSVAAYEAGITSQGKKVQARYDAATQREVWRAAVNGRARGLAVADGRLYVTTDCGEVYCFDSQAVEGRAVRHDPGAAFRNVPAAPPSASAAAVLARIKEAGMDRGYGLAIGDSDGSLSLALAQHTGLRVITVLSDAAAAQTLRERLLATTAWHGSRIHVQHVARLEALPFPQFFANAVIVAASGVGHDGAGRLSGKELYRVLRPCGGILLFPGLTIAEAQKLIEETRASESEMRASLSPDTYHLTPGIAPAIVRGQLPGATDWNSTTLSDRYSKGPLRPLWFGGPAPMEFYERLAYHPTMTAANGRYYYLLKGELVAADAYNGFELWRRYVPREVRVTAVDGKDELLDIEETRAALKTKEADLAWRHQEAGILGLAADARSVYLTLSKAYFRGHGPTCILMDARTGEQKAIYGPPAPATVVNLKSPQSWTIGADATRQGKVTLSADADGLKLDMEAQHPDVTVNDAWDLFFDFRAPESRYGLYGRGTFQVRVLPASAQDSPATWKLLRGDVCPDLEVSGTHPTDGAGVTVRMPWLKIKALTGMQPKTFGFAVTLRSGDGGASTTIKESHLFGDALADSLNNGWATIVIEDAPSDLAVLKAPPVLAGPLEKIPAQFRRSHDRFACYQPDPDAGKAWRTHPLTGDQGPKMYQRGNGCGMVFSSAYTHFMRSSNLGFYDVLDDSGIRQFGGIRPSCAQNMLAALGLLIVGEDGSACVCQYSFQTPLAFAPAEKRLNEDWAQFYDLPVDNQLRQAAFNLGAPGDRRDSSGTLWLGFPRFSGGNAPLYTPGVKSRSQALNGVWPKQTGYGIAAPLEVETAKEFGPYRVNADRVAIRNTDRPWIYTSGYRGIRKATLKLDFRKPLVSQPVNQPIVLDGKLDDAAWGEKPQTILPFTKTALFLRHDAENLYVAARRPAVVNKDGKAVPWRKTVRGDDAEIWLDDAVELFVGDLQGSRVAHLGVAASGARYDALADTGADKEDSAWNGAWKSAVTADAEHFGIEIATPLAVLKNIGLDLEMPAINFQMNQQTDAAYESTYGEALCFLGGRGRSRCVNFMPLGLGKTPTLSSRSFTVRLHFAEPDDIRPGHRVFDVKLQNQVVLENFDVVKEAGGVRAALVKEFKNIRAEEALTIEFLAANKEPTAATAPIVSAMEVFDETLNLNPTVDGSDR